MARTVLVGVLAVLLGMRLFGPPDPSFLGRALVVPTPAMRAEAPSSTPDPSLPAMVADDSAAPTSGSPVADVVVSPTVDQLVDQSVAATESPAELATAVAPVSSAPLDILATSAPPVAPPSTVAPTVAPPSAAVVQQRAAAVEASLRSGLFTAVTEYNTEARAIATLRLDLNQPLGVRRVHLITTYQQATQAQTVEYILIGNRCWQRPATGGWTTLPCQPGFWEHVQTFLPNVGAVNQVEAARPDAAADGLRWYDREAALETLLTVDATTGIPRELRQMTPGGNLVRVVRYTGWNSPVEISPPVTP